MSFSPCPWPIGGVDHIVITVADLDEAERTWSSLGFTLSPRGYHPDEVGTANHTIMLGDQYIELLGIVRPTPYNEGTRRFLEGGGGVEALAFASRDAAEAATRIRDQGHIPTGPGYFDREVGRRDGAKGVAWFGIVRWPDDVSVAGTKFFVCEPQAPDWVWLPELNSHPNEALAIAAIYVASDHPDRDAAAFLDLGGEGYSVIETDVPAFKTLRQANGCLIHFAPIDDLKGRLGDNSRPSTRREGVIAIDIAIRNATPGGEGQTSEQDLPGAAPMYGSGMMLRFVPPLSVS
jgi:catechol 2,3-dioxygenase-like lactoylglutathione lyase family enzyme